MRAFPRRTVNLTLGLIARTLIGRWSATQRPVSEFELRFARTVGSTHALAVSSARLGLYQIVKALDLKPGDEVILGAYNFHAIPSLIYLMGLKPVFVDLAPGSPNLDPAKLEEKITPRTRLVLITHLLGYPAPLKAILSIAEKHDLFVVEDCAHSLGARFGGRMTGTFGHAAIFSFGFSKLLPCFGGGMIVSNDDNLFKKISDGIDRDAGKNRRMSRNMMESMVFYVLTHPYVYPVSVYPLQRVLTRNKAGMIDQTGQEKLVERLEQFHPQWLAMSPVQARLGLLQLDRMEQIVTRIQRNGRILDDRFGSHPQIQRVEPPAGTEPVYCYYKIRLADPARLKAPLLKRGIDVKLDNMCAPADLNLPENITRGFPLAENFRSSSLEIPAGFTLDESDVSYIAKEILALVDRI